MDKKDIIVGQKYRVVLCKGEEDKIPRDYWSTEHQNYQHQIAIVIEHDHKDDTNVVQCIMPNGNKVYFYSTGLEPIEETTAPDCNTNTNEDSLFIHRIKNLEI